MFWYYLNLTNNFNNHWPILQISIKHTQTITFKKAVAIFSLSERVCSSIKLVLRQMLTSPGPASTVEEHSLRKIASSMGTAVRSSPRIFIFSSRAIFIAQLCLTENIQLSDKIQSRNLGTEQSCCDQFDCMKGNVARINWPYDVTSYILLRNSTTTLATWDDNQLSYG